MAIFQPTDISGVFAWYKAHSLSLSESGVVTYWQDSSGSGNHLSFVPPSSNNTCPLFVPAQLNGYPIIRFDGIDDYLAGTGSYFSQLPPSSLTAFLVYQTNSTSVEQAIFVNDNDDGGSPTVGAKNNFILGINNSNNGSGFYFSWGKDRGVAVYTANSSGIHNPASQWTVRSDRWRLSDNAFVFGLNGAEYSGSIASMSQSITNRIKVGATVSNGYSTAYFNGDIAEIVAYSRRLTNDETDRVTNYLLYKYNIPNTLPLTLFMWTADNGSESGLYNTIPLYSYSINTSTSGLNLYTISSNNYSTGIPFFTSSSTSYVSGKPLYISSSSPYSTGISLYIGSANAYSSGINLYIPGSIESKNLEMYIDGYSIHQTGFPLYTASASTATTGIPLYTSAATLLGSPISLFTSATLYSNNIFNLFIPGQTEYSSNSFYIDGHDYSITGLPLYIGTSLSSATNTSMFMTGRQQASGNMQLFIKQIPTPFISSNTSLFITASAPGSSGIYNNILLYMYAHGVADTLPLFIQNSEISSLSSDAFIPLFISAPNLYSGISHSVNLAVYNNTTITGKMTKLYIRGDGVMDGALIYSDNMPLFLKQNIGIDRGIDLYLYNSQQSLTAELPMYISGVYNYNNNVDLVISGGGYSNSIDLYLTAANIINSGIGLVTKGQSEYNNNVRLYTHGY